MCYCERDIQKEFCNVGPCNLTDISSFQNIVREFAPSTPISTQNAVVRSYAKDFAAWKINQANLERAKKIAELAAGYLDKAILDTIRTDPH